MTNYILSYAKKTIPFIYLFIQLLIILILNITLIINQVHLVLSALAIITYFIIAFSNPGYVIYGSFSEPPPISISQPVIPTFQVSPRALVDQIVVDQLGIESFIQDQASKKDKEVIIEPQDPFKVLSLVKQEEKQIKQQLQKKDKQAKSHALFEKLDKAKHQQDKIKQSAIENKMVVQESAGFTVCPSKLKSIARWCKICKNSQDLRARHCLQCKKCVSNFDHHCPWINNCIGQKNKLKLIIYIFIQNTQLIYILFWVGKNIESNIYKSELTFLWIVLFCITLMVSSMLMYQLFLIMRNISTWEHVRWNKIEYLRIFNQYQLKSLFNRGLINNISIFFKANCSKEKIDWLQHISPQAHNNVIESQIQTDRRISK